MARRHESDHEAGNDSSFLDVITNCVGILIILVIVVGERAKNAPILQAMREASDKLAAAKVTAAEAESEVHALADEMAVVHSELVARSAERTEVNTLVAAVEAHLAERRAGLDEQSRQRFDLDRELAAAQAELDRLEAERRQVERASVAPKVVEVESYPTPIGKTVEDKEAHFQLSEGRLAYVPIEAFKEKLYDRLRELARNTDQSDLSDTLGPIGGFRLRYTLERFDTPRGAMAQVSYFEMIPGSPQLGEPIEVALGPKSQLRSKLQMISPRTYTITVWTYGDSFAEYRQLKKELYALGYSVAARPLPAGMPIAGSPQGSKSSAQ